MLQYSADEESLKKYKFEIFQTNKKLITTLVIKTNIMQDIDWLNKSILRLCLYTRILRMMQHLHSMYLKIDIQTKKNELDLSQVGLQAIPNHKLFANDIEAL